MENVIFTPNAFATLSGEEKREARISLYTSEKEAGDSITKKGHKIWWQRKNSSVRIGLIAEL